MLNVMTKMIKRISRISSNLSRLYSPPTLDLRPILLQEIALQSLMLLRETAGRVICSS